uniref:DUF2249 domain-containing protein n=1 Tax=Haloprofundus sp. MHR1 TaxID=2572921 RepID=UPI001F1623B9|nr:DUF2249 domain-containing protein [Haloprofundus sp. MHR1]
MGTEIDLTGASREDVRDRLYELFNGVEAGDTLHLIADQVPGFTLLRYQIERSVQFSWDVTRDADEVRMAIAVEGDLAADALPDFDVRVMPPQRRHEVLLEGFDELAPGEGFVLVNDHDPKPLYHELRSTRGETFEWEYLDEGGREWRVAIEKTEESTAPDDDVITRYDVRQIPKPERHPSIHHRYGMIPEGEAMEIVAPHEPRPLKQEFQQRYGDAFEWQIVEQEPGRVAVRITKRADVHDEDAEANSCAGEDAHHDGHTHHAGGELDGDGEAVSGTDEDPSVEVSQELDVREYPPARRHELIFQAYDDLERGEAFVLVNDHDPKPLYHQFTAEEGPEFHWQYRQKDPGEFRVLVGKVEPKDQEASSDPAEGGTPF